MSLELALILGLILHFAGDYLLQNDWMAKNKTRENFVCYVHCLLYTLPFGLVLRQSPWLFFVFATHFAIDRWRLAEYWIRLVNWHWSGDNYGYDETKPKYMSVWLLIVIDNTFHILLNSLAIWLSRTTL
jgi:hypothetical protein